MRICFVLFGVMLGTAPVLASPNGAPAPMLVLVDHGLPRAVLVLPAQPTPLEQQAADELRADVKKISGAELPIVHAGDDLAGRTPIRLGRAAGDAAIDPIREKGQPDAFVVKVDRSGASLRGLTDRGTLFAAYEVLEQLGVRWFMPGELGTVMPEADTLELKAQDDVQVPAFAMRQLSLPGADSPWGQHTRLGGDYFPSAHGIPPFKGSAAKRLFKEHPEYFALVDGKRSPKQIDVANPQVLKLTVAAVKDFFRKNPDAPWIGMGPNDGDGFSEDPVSMALDGDDRDSFASAPSMTDRYIWFFNHVLEGIHDEFPDKKIAFYIYADYVRPPVRYTPDPRIVGALAPITLCRVHGPGNPVCPEKSYYAWLIGAWSKKLSTVYDRGYWFNLADPGFPFIMVHRLRHQIPLAHKLGIAGWRVETAPKWASETPSLYIAAKLMWNPDADVDALMQDFYDKFYGPAAEPMGAYTQLMIDALANGDYHTGGAFDMPLLYPAALRDKARALLDRAAASAGDGVFAKRVALTRKSFDYLQAFIDMLDQRNRGDFKSAKASLDRLEAIQHDLLTGYDVPMLHEHAATRYMARFWSPAVEQGYARTTPDGDPGGELVAMLDDRWRFLTDPQGLGESIDYQRADDIGGNWQTIKTSSASWSDQGLRYDTGLAWYRQRVEIPASFKGRRVFLWFGGVDEKAKVWVNGKPVGISPGSAFLPFEFDATDAVTAGEDNTVAVLIDNQHLDELGTGGITAPVMFYAPSAGEHAELHNVKPLGTTFP